MALFNENKFKVRKLDKIADKIEALAPKYSTIRLHRKPTF